MTLQEKTVEKLIENNYHIAFAESCTGGMCCAALVDVANASRVLDMSFVTYANEAKIKLLGVDENTQSILTALFPSRWRAKWHAAFAKLPIAR